MYRLMCMIERQEICEMKDGLWRRFGAKFDSSPGLAKRWVFGGRESMTGERRVALLARPLTNPINNNASMVSAYIRYQKMK